MAMPSAGVGYCVLMRWFWIWLRWQGVISDLATPIEDRLMIPGSSHPRGYHQGSMDGGERTFPSTLSMLQLATRQPPSQFAYAL